MLLQMNVSFSAVDRKTLGNYYYIWC